MHKLRVLILLFIIFFIGIFLRFYKLDKFPVQLNHDEVTQLYDAISISTTGHDIYGNFMPFIFPSIGDYKPPFYTYITVIFYFIFGPGELTVRLPAAIFGSLMVPAVFLFVLKLLNNNKIAIIASFFTAIAPFGIFFSRKSFENEAGIFLILLGFIFLFMNIKQNKGIKFVYLASFLFASAVYTYFSHAIILPILLIVFVLIYKDFFFNNWKKYLGPIVLFLFLYLPLLFLIAANPNVSFRSKTVFITQDTKLGQQVDLSKIDNKLLDHLLADKTIFNYAFNRYLKQFDPIYLFANGLDMTNQGPIGSGPLLLIELPLILFGIFYLVKLNKRASEVRFIFCWIIIGMIPSGLTFEQFSPHRVVMVFTMLNIIAAIGLYNIIILIRKYNIIYLVVFSCFFSFALFLNLTNFLHIYFINYPNEKSQNLQYPFKQVVQYMWANYNNYDAIIFDPVFGQYAPVMGVGAHYYLAYFGHLPPAEFQKKYKHGNKEGEMVLDKFSIRKVDFREDRNLKNALIIASPWRIPDNIDKSKIIKTFKFYDNKNNAFYAIKL